MISMGPERACGQAHRMTWSPVLRSGTLFMNEEGPISQVEDYSHAQEDQ